MVNAINDLAKMPSTIDGVPQEYWGVFGNMLLEHATLLAATAVFMAMVDDVHFGRLELIVAGDAERHGIRSGKRMISTARKMAKGLVGTPALAGASARAITRGSPDAMSWYQEWATVHLQTLCRIRTYTLDTLRPGNWEQLRIRLRFKHANGQRTVLTSSVAGTAMETY